MAKKSVDLTPWDRVVAIIEERGLSQSGAAVAAGLERSCLPSAKTTKRLSLETIQAFAGFLKVPVGQLIGEAPAPAEGAGLVAARSSDTMMLSFGQLEISKLNPRKTLDSTKIDELASSIEAQGILQNLVARPGRGGANTFVVIAGHRRHEAVGRLVEIGKWDRDAANIPVRIRHVDDAEHIALALLENLMREDVNPMEEAEAFQRLQEMDPRKWAASAIAKHIGMSARHVQLRLALTKTSPAVQKALRDGKINLAMARTLTMLPPSKQATWVSGDREFATAEQLRDNITCNMIPTSKAKFDAATSGANVMTDPDTGKSWFTDRAEFLQLQEKAAKKIAADLKKEWAWVQEGNHFFASEFEKEKSTDHKKAGAFVEVDYRGEITVHTGLIKAKTKNAQKRQQQAEEAEKRTQTRLLGEHLSRTLQASAIDNARLAHIYYLYDQLAGEGYLCDGLPAFVITKVQAMGCILPFVETKAHDPGLLFVKEDADLAALWRAMATLTDGDLSQAVSACLARNISISWPSDDEIPALREMCVSAGVTWSDGPFEESEEVEVEDDDDDTEQLDIEDADTDAAAE